MIAVRLSCITTYRQWFGYCAGFCWGSQVADCGGTM